MLPEDQFARRLADAILRDRAARDEVLAPDLLTSSFARRLDDVAAQVNGGLGPGFTVAVDGPGRAALSGIEPYGLFYDRDADGRATRVEIYPMRFRPPPAWLRAPWFVVLVLAVPLLPAGIAAVTPGLAPAAAALLLALVLRVNGRWDVVGVQARPWWFFLMVAAATVPLVRGGLPAAVRPGGSGTVAAVLVLIVTAPAIVARRRPPATGEVAMTAVFRPGVCGYVLQGGASQFLNHHFRHPEQRWALDVVPVGGPARRNRIDAGDRVEVLAPVPGRVVRAVDGQPDRPAAGEAVHPFGNHVVIEYDGSVRLYLCHLARDSVAVRAGDIVAAGDPVGVVGTSGRSTEPHLHLHAVRPGAGPVPLTMAGRPLWRGRLMSAPPPGCRSTPGSRTP